MRRHRIHIWLGREVGRAGVPFATSMLWAGAALSGSKGRWHLFPHCRGSGPPVVMESFLPFSTGVLGMEAASSAPSLETPLVSMGKL